MGHHSEKSPRLHGDQTRNQQRSFEDPTAGHLTTVCEKTGLVKVSTMGNLTILCLLGLCLFFLACESRPMYDNYGSQRYGWGDNDRWGNDRWGNDRWGNDRWGNGDWDRPWGDYQDFQGYGYPSRYNDYFSWPQNNWRYESSYRWGNNGDWDRQGSMDWRDHQGFRDYDYRPQNNWWW